MGGRQNLHKLYIGCICFCTIYISRIQIFLSVHSQPPHSSLATSLSLSQFPLIALCPLPAVMRNCSVMVPALFCHTVISLFHFQMQVAAQVFLHNIPPLVHGITRNLLSCSIVKFTQNLPDSRPSHLSSIHFQRGWFAVKYHLSPQENCRP